MKPASFVYHAPRTVDEAVGMLAQFAPQDGRILAGGQSLVPAMAYRLARPEHLIDINGVASLVKLGIEGSELTVGALVRHAAFHKADPSFGELGRMLVNVAQHIAHYPIRMRGTMCGSLAHADPASEWCLVAATLDAKLIAKNANGSRVIPAADYFQGLMTTALTADELLAEVRLPLLPDGTKHGFYEFNRRAGDFAIGMALVTYKLLGNTISEAHVALGGIEEKPRRIAAAEATLNGQSPGAAAFAVASEATRAAVDPIEDAQTPAAYRRELAGTVVLRALEQAAA